jgi:general stress protein 26
MKIIDASAGMGSPLSETEVQEFLSNSKFNIYIATTDRQGRPNIHPAWYYYEPQNGKLYINTSKNSTKTDNIRENRNLYLCIDDPNPPYKGVKGGAICTILEDLELVIPIAERIMIKYLGSLEHPTAKGILLHVKNGESVLLEMTPRFYSTWDYSK